MTEGGNPYQQTNLAFPRLVCSIALNFSSVTWVSGVLGAHPWENEMTSWFVSKIHKASGSLHLHIFEISRCVKRPSNYSFVSPRPAAFVFHMVTPTFPAHVFYRDHSKQTTIVTNKVAGSRAFPENIRANGATKYYRRGIPLISIEPGNTCFAYVSIDFLRSLAYRWTIPSKSSFGHSCIRFEQCLLPYSFNCLIFPSTFCWTAFVYRVAFSPPRETAWRLW